MTLSFNGKMMKQDNVENQNGFGFLWVADQEAKAGQYSVTVSNLRFDKDTKRDFVVNVYASTKVAVTDKYGQTSD